MVDKDDLDELRRLGPRERLRKLRDIEQKNKDEIEKAQKLMRESEVEIARLDELSEIPVPEAREVDVRKLFAPEEKKTLEHAVAEEAEQRGIELPKQYESALEEAKQLVDTLSQAYGAIKEMVGEAYQGTLSQENAARLESYKEAAEKAAELLYAAGVKPGEDPMKVVDATDELIYTAMKQLKGESTLRYT